MKKILKVGLLFFSLLGMMSNSNADFLGDFPKLKDLTFTEPNSPLRLGVSLTPVGIMKNKTYLAASLFQAHWFSEYLDLEILSASFGFGNARASYADSRHFILRTVPKIRLLNTLSLGFIAGYELVTFPNTISMMYSNRYA